MKKVANFILNPIYSLFALTSKNYEMLIAMKYVFRLRREFNFITVITFISFLGMMLGIAALIVVISIFNGFRDFAAKQLTDFDPHIRVTLSAPADTAKFENFLAHNSINSNYFQIKTGKAILRNGNTFQAGLVYAVPNSDNAFLREMQNRIIAGKFDLASRPLPRIVLGVGVAEKLSVLEGDTILLSSPDMLESSIKSLNTSFGTRAIISGIFSSNYKEYDESMLFTSLEIGRMLFYKSGENNLIYDIRLNDFSKCTEMADALALHFPHSKITTWFELHRDMFNIMQLERLLVFIILSIIICIALFNLLASLSMTVIEKQHDISLLKAIGLSDKSVRKVFLLCGAYIGILAVFWGTVFGLAFCYGQMQFNWLALDTSKYLLKGLPISIDYFSILIIDIFTVILSIVSTLLPIKYAGTQQISEFLRNN